MFDVEIILTCHGLWVKNLLDLVVSEQHKVGVNIKHKHKHKKLEIVAIFAKWIDLINLVVNI